MALHTGDKEIISTTYVGPTEHLQQKAALVRVLPDEKDMVVAQFNDLKTGLGVGWHRFNKLDFSRWSPRV